MPKQLVTKLSPTEINLICLFIKQSLSFIKAPRWIAQSSQTKCSVQLAQECLSIPLLPKEVVDKREEWRKQISNFLKDTTQKGWRKIRAERKGGKRNQDYILNHKSFLLCFISCQYGFIGVLLLLLFSICWWCCWY